MPLVHRAMTTMITMTLMTIMPRMGIMSGMCAMSAGRVNSMHTRGRVRLGMSRLGMFGVLLYRMSMFGMPMFGMGCGRGHDIRGVIPVPAVICVRSRLGVAFMLSGAGVGRRAVVMSARRSARLSHKSLPPVCLLPMGLPPIHYKFYSTTLPYSVGPVPGSTTRHHRGRG